MEFKKLLYRCAFFVGWILSPFTFWNDSFVNIPISYICANIVIRHFRVDFLLTVLAFYWVTNALGILIMYLSGKGLMGKRRGHHIKESVKLALAIILYTVVLIILNRMGILRPI